MEPYPFLSDYFMAGGFWGRGQCLQLWAIREVTTFQGDVVFLFACLLVFNIY